MKLNETFENAKNVAVGAAQTAAAKAKELAAIAKANISIFAEEDKVKKAELEIGKLFYRDYAVGEEMDLAEYAPWCQKIDDAKKTIAELRDYIDAVRAGEKAEPCEEVCEEAEPCDAVCEEAEPCEKACEEAESCEEACETACDAAQPVVTDDQPEA